MNSAKLAAALNTISVAFGELAEALIESEAGEREVRLGANPTATTPPPAAPAGAAIPPAPPELSPFEEVTWEPPENLPAEPQGSLEQCPKHHAAYKDGKFGKFCSRPSDDPAWANAKGYCTINPKNAVTWLRAQAA